VRDTTALGPFQAAGPEARLLGPPAILEPPRDGTQLDPYLVQRALLESYLRNPWQVLVMDTSQAKDIAAWAAHELGCEVIDRDQSNSFAVADYAAFMAALRQGWLKHLGEKTLNRHVLNAVARMLPGGDTRFDRPAQSRHSDSLQQVRVIDGLTAAAMVNSFYALALEAPRVERRRWVPLRGEAA
jgi:hypothetical protein